MYTTYHRSFFQILLTVLILGSLTVAHGFCQESPIAWDSMGTNTPFQMYLQTRHESVCSLSMSRDGKFFITMNEHSYKIWRTDDGVLLRTVVCAATQGGFSSDGNYVILWSGGSFFYMGEPGYYTSLQVRKSNDGSLVREFNPKIPDGGRAVVFCLDPNGSRVALGSEKGGIFLYDPVKGVLLREFRNAHEGGIERLHWTKDGKLMSVHKQILKVWDVAEGKNIKSYTLNVSSIEVFISDTLVLVKKDSGTVGLNLEDGSIRYTVSLGDYSRLIVSPDGTLSAAKVGNRMIVVFDAQTGKIKTKLRDFSSSTYGFAHAFTPDGKRLLAAHDPMQDGSTLSLWDVTEGKKLESFNPIRLGSTKALAFHEGEKLLAVGTDEGVVLWDLKELRPIHTFTPPGTWVIEKIRFSEDGKKLWVLTPWSLSIYDPRSGNRLFLDKVPPATPNQPTSSPLYSMLLAEDHSVVAKKYYRAEENKWIIEIYQLPGMTQVRKLELDSRVFNVTSVSSAGKYLILENEKYLQKKEPKYAVMESSSGKFAFIPNYYSISAEHKPVFNSKGNLVSYPYREPNKYTNELALFNLERETVEKRIPLTKSMYQTFQGGFFSPGPWILGNDGDNQDQVVLVDKGNPNRTKAIRYGDPMVLKEALSSSDGKRVFVCGEGVTHILEVETGKRVSLVSYGSEWVVYTDEGYFDSSRNAGDIIKMVKGMTAWNIEQFAYRYNRPDLILNRLGTGEPRVVKELYAQFQRRLRKAGLREDQLKEEFHLPEARIQRVERKGEDVALTAELFDSRYELRRYQVYVNDVPLLGAVGKEVTGRGVVVSERVKLAPGRNKIEVSVVNAQGVESYRAVRYESLEEERAGDLYFLGFGVSRYRDGRLNLQYADKDVKDLEGMFRRMEGKEYEKVKAHVWVNEGVTKQALEEAKKILLGGKVEDTVVLFIAGHGMHDTDRDLTYYYLSHGAEVNNLKGTCIDFAAFEELLQGIPQRKKLFLMDTCESGDLEPEMVASLSAQAIPGSSARAVRGLTVTGTQEGRQSQVQASMFRDRYLYNDLNRRSGAIVFSSSKGGEVSYEGGPVKNGFFTAKILECVKDSEADQDGDEVISSDELRKYVSRKVAELSEGKQNPTVDRDNLYQKVQLSLLPEK
ncbi:MAG: caspase family protein [Spirochaetes bacterium]|nr:caspase family protein [Spirochaetota bacterium]